MAVGAGCCTQRDAADQFRRREIQLHRGERGCRALERMRFSTYRHRAPGTACGDIRTEKYWRYGEELPRPCWSRPQCPPMAAGSRLFYGRTGVYVCTWKRAE